MSNVPLAAAADQANALITARRAKNWLFLLLFLVLLLQLATFVAARYTNVILPSETAATQPSFSARDLLRYLIGISDFAGVALACVLAMVLLLTVLIMVVARTLGVSRITSAYVWSLVLIVLLFPWQAFLDPAVFKVPGILYTWAELARDARFQAADMNIAVVRWARFLVFPLAAIIILLIIQVQTTRGMKLALGEVERAPEQPA